MVFTDTSALFALYVPTDRDHSLAWDWYSKNSESLVTSDYVIDELLTLFRSRGEVVRAIEAGYELIDRAILRVERITATDFDAAWAIFRDFRDKLWSFTDCTSLVIMARLGIKRAFAFDEHFRQFGTVTVVPKAD